MAKKWYQNGHRSLLSVICLLKIEYLIIHEGQDGRWAAEMKGEVMNNTLRLAPRTPYSPPRTRQGRHFRRRVQRSGRSSTPASDAPLRSSTSIGGGGEKE
jgi:hypothetical protein